MLAKRTISAVVILFGCLALVIADGWIFTIGACVVLSIASWEYANMFIQGGNKPSFPVLIISNTLIIVSARWPGEDIFLAVFAFAVLFAVISQIFLYKNNQQTSAVDLAVVLSGMIFIGFMGSYFIRLRFLPDGIFWLILAVAPAGFSDIGAFLIGSSLGRRRLAPDLSPNKTIEGYLGGLFTSMIIGYAAGVLAGLLNPSFSGFIGLILGTAVGIVSPLGDLGKSLIKRQFNLKHTSNIIPGHGGVLDRVDTWFWAAVVGYYLIRFFLI
jgi:phosphatidate cytidylyltransferase